MPSTARLSTGAGQRAHSGHRAATWRWSSEPQSCKSLLHNGAGGFSRETYNFRESGSASSVTRGTDKSALALSAGLPRGRPTGLSFGGFASINARGSDRTALGEHERGYGSAGARLYYGERAGGQPVRFKLETVGTQYESVDGFAQRAFGVGVLGALRAFGHGEVFLRGDCYWTDIEGPCDVFGTVGVSYSPSEALDRDYRDLRVTTSYLVRRNAEGDLGHLFILQGQIVF